MLKRVFWLGAMASLLTACSVYSTYEKCGFHGCAGDADISALVRERLAQYPSLQPPNIIRVETLNRVVYLTGQVDTDTQRQLAEQLARTVPRVTSVVDSIGLDYGGR